ncbi:MAG TPA: M20/M25/M40 family metallo-hydrolase, partial [Thermomicrobiales bacterium]|nr:M20/M25/M40 family metallo-hydrolase [Thermomicrobiales bacterium]
MSLEAVLRTINERAGEHVAALQRVVRQPSISSQDIGVRECAELLVSMMSELGIDARVMETAGRPVVFGHIRTTVANAPTLVIYNHYDVQPPEPLGEWEYPPFGAEIHDGIMYGRGTTDAKGNLLCHLMAIDGFRAAGVPLPCNIKLLFDGEEESGSPSLPAFVDANKELLAADAALSFDGGFAAGNKPRINFGSSGLYSVEIRVQGAQKDLHSARARLVQNPAWRLIWALNELKGPDGRINLPGFYDKIR